MNRALDNRRKSRIRLNEKEILRSTIYQLNEGVIVADKEGRFLICNEAAQSILAIGVDENSPKSWGEIHGYYMPDGVTPYAPEELPATRALAGETVPETEIYIRNAQCPAGIWIHAKASPLKERNGYTYTDPDQCRGADGRRHYHLRQGRTDRVCQSGL
jgi:PAS domain-containing protein